MKAITVREDVRGADALVLADLPDPAPGDEDLLIDVHASALNRADILQREGGYPPQHGASPILGLELAGEVLAAGKAVRGFKPGDRVYGLCGGGGYAQRATLHQDLAMRIPDAWDYQTAASVPEVFFTANTVIRTLGRLQPGETALIHAGGSGVGIAAIQIARLVGGRAWVTAGSAEKIVRCQDLGATVGINYKNEDFAIAVDEHTNGRGVDLILDVIGADYWDRNLRAAAEAGRIVLVGMMGGSKAETNLGIVLRKRLQVFGTVMRSRPHADRAAITRDYQAHLEPALVDGRMHPVIDRVFPLREAAEAHRYMEANQNFGKIVLDVAGGA